MNAASPAGANRRVDSWDIDLLNTELFRIDLSRWFSPSVAWVLVTILLQGLLFCADWQDWYLFDKGYTVLVTVAVTGVSLLLLGGCVLVSLVTRSRSQFSLATLLLMTAVVAMPFAWLAREIDTARRQGAIVESLRRRNLQPLYGDNFRGAIFPQICGPQMAAWLESRLGREFFSDVTYIEMRNATDVDLEAISLFAELDLLVLDRGTITDEGLAHLEGHKKLRGLSLVNTQISDNGLVHVKKLPRLRWVFLGGTSVTRKGAEELRKAMPACNVIRTRHWPPQWLREREQQARLRMGDGEKGRVGDGKL